MNLQSGIFDAQWRTSATLLDRLARPRVRLAGRMLPSFTLLAGIGLACGIGFALVAAALRGLSLPVAGCAALAGLGSAAASAMAAKIATGRERLVFYRETLAAMAGASVAVALAGEPVLPYLDIAAVSVALIGAFGRTGCLMVGCCHGRPAAWGVAYGEAHVAQGFPSYYAGARLLPVQAIESALHALLAAGGAALLFSGTEPGVATGSCAIAYAAGRLALETGRGDRRNYHRGLSSAQWTSLFLAAAVVLLETAGALPLQGWHALVAPGMLFVAIGIRAPSGLLRADHVAEFAWLVSRIAAEPRQHARIARTSAGLAVSGGKSGSSARAVLHFTFSDSAAPLPEPIAGALAEIVVRMLAPAGTAQLVHRPGGIAHLIIPRLPAVWRSGDER
jgi:hypothetical protein